MAEFAERYLKEHIAVYCKPSSEKMYRGVVQRFLVSDGHLAAVEREDDADSQYRLRDKP